ncbi:hypothetical protein Ahy_B06g085128 isoform A [Arachis hypogaea]|uniref:Uncharacterized protein n=1 Tax=Arachis hypogaea TaxID=3818 RepID=A0A444YTL7_ARAHY|nr:hypothetical protein Ahy_B06g085128 isoform A [Arachis hypogaea]
MLKVFMIINLLLLALSTCSPSFARWSILFLHNSEGADCVDFSSVLYPPLQIFHHQKFGLSASVSLPLDSSTVVLLRFYSDNDLQALQAFALRELNTGLQVLDPLLGQTFWSRQGIVSPIPKVSAQFWAGFAPMNAFLMHHFPDMLTLELLQVLSQVLFSKEEDHTLY